MKKILFYIFHFALIFCLQLYLFLNSGLDIKYIPILTEIKEDVLFNSPIKHYMVFTGINTGYGFYGVNVATNKYFFIELLDKNKKVIENIEVNDFKTANSFSRFETSTSWIYNFHVETEELENKIKKNKAKKKYCEIRKDYEKKIYKYIGLYYAKKNSNCKFYNIKLATVVPPNIWEQKLEKNNIYVIKELSFKISK